MTGGAGATVSAPSCLDYVCQGAGITFIRIEALNCLRGRKRSSFAPGNIVRC